MKRSDLKRFIKIPALSTERLTLRKIKRSDVLDVFEYASDERVSRFLMWSPHETLDFTKKYLAYVDSRYRRGEFYDWGIEYLGKMIGTVGFTSFSVENNSAEIGYVLSSKYWGIGIATEAVKKILEYGFCTLNLNRIEAHYMVGNDESRRVMDKCHAVFEGIMRGAVFAKNKYHDVAVMSVMREEYFENRKLGII